MYILYPLSVLLLVFSTAFVKCDIGITPLQFFLGNGKDVDKVIAISFPPDEGLKLRERFERKYGFRGEKLIASFGDGYYDNEENEAAAAASPKKQKDLDASFLF